MVKTINQMITKKLISQEMYEYQFGEFVSGYWGLKG